jgi:cysteinyl-tRNA synthetase
MWILTSHYRKPLTFTEDTLDAAKHGVERLRTAARAPSSDGEGGVEISAFRDRFTAAMDDDLNTPQALAVLFDLAKEANRARDEGHGIAAAQGLLLELADVLGLRLEQAEQSMEAAPFIDLLIQVRSDLRAAKQWQLADRVRDGLKQLNITLEDGPQGTTWKPD